MININLTPEDSTALKTPGVDQKGAGKEKNKNKDDESLDLLDDDDVEEEEEEGNETLTEGNATVIDGDELVREDLKRKRETGGEASDDDDGDGKEKNAKEGRMKSPANQKNQISPVQNETDGDKAEK